MGQRRPYWNYNEDTVWIKSAGDKLLITNSRMAVKGDSSNGTAVIAMIHERTREDKSAEKISCAPPLARSGRLTHRRAMPPLGESK